MIKTILLPILMTVCFAGVHIQLSDYSDNSTYIHDNAIKALYVVSGDEYSANLSLRETPSYKLARASAGVDRDIDDSHFIFGLSTVEKSSRIDYLARIGGGSGIIIGKTLFDWPFIQKHSIAVMQDNKHGMGLSYRLKLNGYVERVGFSVVLFNMWYSNSIDYKLSLPILNNMDVIYKGYYDKTDGIELYQSAFGAEIKL